MSSLQPFIQQSLPAPGDLGAVKEVTSGTEGWEERRMIGAEEIIKSFHNYGKVRNKINMTLFSIFAMYICRI